MSSTATINVKKIGVRYRPPTIFLFYIDMKTGKTRRHTVVFTDFTIMTDINAYAKELHNDRVTKNRNLFRFVPLRRLERLLFVLKEGQTGNPTRNDIEKKLHQFDALDANEDLNKLDDETLQHKKLIMNETYERNLVLPTSKDFIYDKTVDFEATQGDKQTSDWDTSDEIQEDLKAEDVDDDDDDDDDFR
jgi:centrosomal protein CEP19